MENREKHTSVNDGLINPSNINIKKTNQTKVVNLTNDGLMERFKNKVVTNDGRELLGENNQDFLNIL